MGFLNKIKDILFEEVEDEEVNKGGVKVDARGEEKRPIAEKIEPKRVEMPEARPNVSQPQRVQAETDFQPKSSRINTINDIDSVYERDLFKSDNTFPFPDFDEEEFSQSLARPQKQTTNVLEYEKKKKIEKKYDMGRFERIERTEVVEKKKFKPSPIISPVYGILNEDYKIEDIKDKTNDNNKDSLDFNSVRNKAFGHVEALEEKPVKTKYEETVTVNFREPEEEKQQKVRTIDELLEETSDVEIDVPDVKIPDIEPKEEYEKVDNYLEPDIRDTKSKTNTEAVEDDDTLENDLFDLIDSMYDNREDGED